MTKDTDRMTKQEMIDTLKGVVFNSFHRTTAKEREALNAVIESLEQEPCDDCISRQAVLYYIEGSEADLWHDSENELVCQHIKEFPPVTPQPKMGHCKDCKYFEYDSVAKVDGIPLIVAHEICKRWGDGCKTKEDGYCFLFEPKDDEE